MRRLPILYFDVNETLLDLAPLKASVAQALGGRADLLAPWFTTMLHYSLVATMGDRYEDFGEIGAAALVMVAKANGVTLAVADAREAVAPIRSLPPHDDVEPGLNLLKEAGFRMVALTNSSQAGVDAQMANAGLGGYFERRLSVEPVRKFKPHPEVYAYAAREMGVGPGDCLLVAAHGWDIAGALWAGWRGAFVDRPSAALYPLAAQPEIVGSDLRHVAEGLVARAG